MGKEALSIGADTFAFFTRNPRGGRARALDPQDVRALLTLMQQNSFAPLVAHAPYTMNLCSDRPEAREFARQAMAQDLERLSLLPGTRYNFHPGSHVGQGAQAGIEAVGGALRDLLPGAGTTTVLLETMAGKGTELGRSFEEIHAIIVSAGQPPADVLGVCLDTCHVHDAGYDIVGDLDGVLREFDRVVGLERLHAVHLNDSKNPAGSRKDRHEKIGQGTIGLDALVRVVSHPALRDLPFILETPNELDGYAQEIKTLRALAG